MIFGYSLSFAPAFPNNHTNEVWGDASRLWLRGMTLRTFHYLAPTIPESVYCTFQLTFAIITAALICGSFADRMKVSYYHYNCIRPSLRQLHSFRPLRSLPSLSKQIFHSHLITHNVPPNSFFLSYMMDGHSLFP